MDERRILIPIASAGTLSANATWYVRIPFPCTLLSVSAVGSNSNSATIKVGNSTNAEYYLAAFDFGDGGVPAVKGRGDWNTTYVTAAHPHLDGGQVVILTIDYDGNSGTAIADPVVILEVLVG